MSPRDLTAEEYASLVEPARLRALEEARLLGPPLETTSETLDRITRIAAGLVDAGTCTVSIVTADDQRFVGATGLTGERAVVRATGLERSFCKYVAVDEEPLVIDDSRADPTTAGSPPSIDETMVAYAGVPLITPDGHAIGALCVMGPEPRHWTEAQVSALTELADWVVAEVELRRRVTQLEHIDHLREQLVQTVSHELRNPLATIVGTASVFHERWDDIEEHKRRALVTTIRDQGDRMLRLVGDLHDAVRLEAGALQLRPEPVSLAAVVTSAVRNARADGLMGDVDVPEEIVVHADPGRLEQVVENLLTNAGKYGAPPVDVSVRDPDEPGVVELVVRDHGEGVPFAFLPSLFGRFQRAGATAAKPGTGLGLAIARDLVRGMGGELTHEQPDDDLSGAVFVTRLVREW